MYGFAKIQKVVLDRTAADHQTVTMTFFWCKFGFGKCSGASSKSNHWTGHHRLSYKIHFLSHITIWSRNGSLLLRRMREDDISKRQSFWFSVNSWSIHLLGFFTSPICFKYQMTVEWSILSSSAISCVALRASASMMALKWSLLIFDGWPLCSSFSRLLSLLQNFLNHHYIVHLLAVPGPNALLMLWVVSSALQSILNWNKKMAWEFTFCLTSFP